jgi:endoglucanase
MYFSRMNKTQFAVLIAVSLMGCGVGEVSLTDAEMQTAAQPPEVDAGVSATGGGSGSVTTGGGSGSVSTGGGTGNTTTGGGSGNTTTGGGNGNTTTGGGNGNTTGGGSGNTTTGGGTGNTATGGGLGTTGGGTGTTTPPGVIAPGSEWLHTSANHILRADGSRWHGRGANLQDTRGCGACTFGAPNVNEVLRRMDMLVDDWGANFIRLTLESYGAANGMTNYAPVPSDPAFLADIKAIVAHARTKPGLYVLISLWIDPSFTSMGWPTAQTNATWQLLARELKNEPRVIFGIVNEPQANYDGALDSQVWTAMNAAVQAIRDVENQEGTPHHLVSVQGTRSWARRLDYYVTHPISAGLGENVIYETHVYDPIANFGALFEQPAQTLPVIIGEFGPASGYMTEADCTQLMTRARALEVPHLAWTFHQRCPPNLIQDNSAGACGINMALAPTSWGNTFKAGLNVAW